MIHRKVNAYMSKGMIIAFCITLLFAGIAGAINGVKDRKEEISEQE